jgi:hypothetical protein
MSVHAQLLDKIEHCAELGRNPSDGESAFSPAKDLVNLNHMCKEDWLAGLGWRLSPKSKICRLVLVKAACTRCSHPCVPGGGGADAPAGTPCRNTDSEIEFGTGLVFSNSPSSGRITKKNAK